MTAAAPTSNAATETLKEEFLKRKKKNYRYSIRSFAKDMGVSHALISKIFSGKSALTPKQAAKMSNLLGLSTKLANQFVASALYGKQKAPVLKTGKYFDSSLEYEKVVGRWFHAALLELTYLKNFRSDPTWIARTLGISIMEARDAIERLKSLNLLEVVGDRLQKTKGMLRFRSSSPKVGLRAHYTTMFSKAVEEMKKTSPEDFHSRYIGGGTLSIRAEKIHTAVKRLQEMQDEFIREFAEDEADEVFTINLQFFKLTKGTKGVHK